MKCCNHFVFYFFFSIILQIDKSFLYRAKMHNAEIQSERFIWHPFLACLFFLLLIIGQEVFAKQNAVCPAVKDARF